MARYRINIVKTTSTKINGNSKRPSRPRAKNLQYTKLQIKLDDSNSDHFHKHDKINKKTHQSAALLFPFNATSKAYGDITGRFPYLSSSGNQYLLITYDHDINAILTEPLNNRTGPEIKHGWLKLNLILTKG